MSPARVGIVGTGWWATHAHIPALLANPDAELVGVCDLRLPRAEEVGHRFGVPHAVAGVDALLALGLDAVVVATPHDAHFEPAAAAIAAGADVLVEKPMTINPSEAWKLVELADAAGVSLHVGYTYPYAAIVRSLRELVRSGALGELNLLTALFSSSVHQFYSGDVEYMRERTGAAYATSPTTYADRTRGGGHLFTQMTHAASVLLFSVERRATSVSARENLGGFTVDLADSIAATLEGGALASLAGTGSIHAHPFRVEEYRIFGAEGRATLDTAAGRLDVALADGTHELTLLEEPEDLESMTSAALVATALDKAEVVVPGELGARVTELLGAARDSAAAGGERVELDGGSIR